LLADEVERELAPVRAAEREEAFAKYWVELLEFGAERLLRETGRLPMIERGSTMEKIKIEPADRTASADAEQDAEAEQGLALMRALMPELAATMHFYCVPVPLRTIDYNGEKLILKGGTVANFGDDWVKDNAPSHYKGPGIGMFYSRGAFEPGELLCVVVHEFAHCLGAEMNRDRPFDEPFATRFFEEHGPAFLRRVLHLRHRAAIMGHLRPLSYCVGYQGLHTMDLLRLDRTLSCREYHAYRDVPILALDNLPPNKVITQEWERARLAIGG
jgi:hypothetical protein